MRAPRHRHVTPYFLRCAGEAIVLDLSGKDICNGLRPRARARRSEKIKHTSHTIYQLDPSLSSTIFYMTLLRFRLSHRDWKLLRALRGDALPAPVSLGVIFGDGGGMLDLCVLP